MHNQIAVALLVLCLTVVALPAQAGKDTFIDSDDYKDGEEVVGKFLKDDAYRKMIEEIERNGEELDWGWVKASGKKPNKPQSLNWEWSSFRTVYIAPVENYAGIQAGSLVSHVQQTLSALPAEWGLQATDDRSSADLEIGVAIVDVKNDGTFIYVGRIDPFIEIEFRLQTLPGEEALALIRNQSHSSTPADAAVKFIDIVSKFLR